MRPAATALLLVGYQNEYFAPDGGLRSLVEDVGAVDQVLANTVALIEGLVGSEALLVSTPITFTHDYAELVDPVGVLEAIRNAGLLREGDTGASTVAAIRRFGERIEEVGGKRGFNAFANTDLDDRLKSHGIEDVVIAGALTSICVDSTARCAQDCGYRVTLVSDCTLARTAFEQRFFCEQIFPLYARVHDSRTVLDELLDTKETSRGHR